MALVALVFLVGLALLVLLLPPVSLGDRLFGPPFLTLNSASPRLELNELALALNPDASGAPSALELYAEQVSAAQFLGMPGPDDLTLQAARAIFPANLTPVSAVYRIEVRGAVAPGAMQLALKVPDGSPNYDLYGYDSAAHKWAFVPARLQTGSQPGDSAQLVADRLPAVVVAARVRRQVPVVSVVVEPGQAFKPEISAVANVVHPAGLRPNAEGALVGALPAGVEPGEGYAVVPLIRADAEVAALLQDAALRDEHVAQLVNFVSSKDYNGLAIDYRDVPAEARDNFSAFVAALARELDTHKAALTVVLPFPAQDGSLFETGAYDWAAIGAAVDTVHLRLPLDPAAYGENGRVQALLTWAVRQISRAKIQVAFQTRCPQKAGEGWQMVGFADALSALGKLRTTPPDSVRAGQPVEANLSALADGQAALDLIDGLPVLDAGGAKTYLRTEAVLRAQLGLIVPYNLAGVQVGDLAAPGAYTGLTDVLAEFKVSRGAWPVAQAAPLMLRWRVLNSDDQVINEQIGAAGVPFTYTPDGAYPALRIEAQSLDFGLTLGSAAIRVANNQ